MTLPNLKQTAVAVAAAFAALSSAAGAPVTYLVTVDTSSEAGVYGYLEFQFSAGAPSAPDAFATIGGFQTDGALNPADIQIDFGASTQGVTGTLPGDVAMFNNSGQTVNDYAQGILFGNSVSFLLTLSGPALDSPPGSGSASTGFSLDFLHALNGSPDASGASYYFAADPSGASAYGWLAGSLEINLDGSITAVADPSLNDLTTPSGLTDVTLSQLVPEPSSVTLFLAGLWGVSRFRRLSI